MSYKSAESIKQMIEVDRLKTMSYECINNKLVDLHEKLAASEARYVEIFNINSELEAQLEGCSKAINDVIQLSGDAPSLETKTATVEHAKELNSVMNEIYNRLDNVVKG